MNMRVAAIDCGTNSIRLLIADTSGPGVLVDVRREMRIVRLGQDTDRTGRLAPGAIERTRGALADYTAKIGELGAERVRLVATSATRDAANRAEFTAMVRATLGIDPEVVSGAEEAALSFAGAAGAVPRSGGRRLLVADIGGGSSELVTEIDGVLRSHSMDVGSVRMTERHLDTDPPDADQIAAVVADVRAAIASARVLVPMDDGVRLVGVAGTVTTVAAIALGLRRYDSAALHGSQISAGQVRAVTARLLGLTRAERAAITVVHPGRVDVICAGALILRTIVDEIGVDSLTVSEHDILDGIALSISE